MPSMPPPARSDQDESPADEVVLGVDTHKEVHVAAVITVLGALLASMAFPATAAGYGDLLNWARTFGTLQRAGVECTGSYGAALSRRLRSEGVEVIEVNQPDKATRRRRGKTDVIDAEAAARAVLSGSATVIAKAGDGPVEMIRMLKLAKASAIKARTQAINQLKAVLIAADPVLREALAGLSNPILIRRCSQLDAATPADVTSAAAYTLRLLACRITGLTSEVHELERHITSVVVSHNPALLQRRGAGPDSAAALLITAGDNPGRLHTEASFAALCGASPVDAPRARPAVAASTGAATGRPTPLSTASPYRACAGTSPTRDYLGRRISEGKTRREAIRCLKRDIAREIYQVITGPAPGAPEISRAA